MLDCGKTIGDHRQACDPERHGPQNVAIVQRHLEAFVEILVVHVVDAIHRMYVGTCEPFHRRVELGHDLVVIEEFGRHGRHWWGDLVPRDLVPAAIDGVQKRLREVHAGAEELHLLA